MQVVHLHGTKYDVVCLHWTKNDIFIQILWAQYKSKAALCKTHNSNLGTRISNKTTHSTIFRVAQALLNNSPADSFTSSWPAKYHSKGYVMEFTEVTAGFLFPQKFGKAIALQLLCKRFVFYTLIRWNVWLNGNYYLSFLQ